MNNKSIPPFFIGQEVVAVMNGNDNMVIKGRNYLINGIKQTSCCGKWVVDIGVSSDKEFNTCSQCPNNGHYLSGGIRWARSILFAPITSTFQSIEYREVLENERQLVSSN